MKTRWIYLSFFSYDFFSLFSTTNKKDTNSELFEKGRLVVFTNDFFTVYQDTNTGEMNISLNEIGWCLQIFEKKILKHQKANVINKNYLLKNYHKKVQSQEEQKRTEALGEKLFLLLKDRPRHRALLTNECKLNHSMSIQNMASFYMSEQLAASGGYLSGYQSTNSLPPLTSQEDETFYTRELIQIYGQPIVPSFHKHFNYQLSNTHYGYRTLRRLLNCDILKKFVKVDNREETKLSYLNRLELKNFLIW